MHSACKPALVICPKSLVDNWARELKLWGYFLIDVLSNQCDADQTADILRRARDRRSEIVLVSYSQIDRFVAELESIRWDVIVFDEGHKLKKTNKASRTRTSCASSTALVDCCSLVPPHTKRPT